MKGTGMPTDKVRVGSVGAGLIGQICPASTEACDAMRG